MITDGNIDRDTARYWCLFCEQRRKSKSLSESELLEDFMNLPLKSMSGNAGKTDAQVEAGKLLLDLKAKNASRLGSEMKYIVNGMDQKDAAVVAQKLIADLDAKGENAAASFARELGETFMSPEKVFSDGSTAASVSPSSNLAKAVARTEKLASGSSRNWLGRIWDVVKGYGMSIADTVSEWFWGGSWDSATWSEKLAMLKTGGIHTLEIAAIAYLVYKIRGWLFPQLKLAWKNLTSGDALAKCTFNDNKGNSYICWFDSKKMQWQLKHSRGISALVHRDDLFVSEDDADSFYATQFFKRFVQQCKAYISPYLDVKRSEEQLKNDDTPPDVKNMLKFIVSNADKIEKSMFGGSYSYFNEAEDQTMVNEAMTDADKYIHYYATFSGKRVDLYNYNKQLIRRFNMKADVATATVSGYGKDAVVAIVMKDGKMNLYKSNGQLVRK